jgi:hypothetical protein
MDRIDWIEKIILKILSIPSHIEHPPASGGAGGIEPGG